MAFNSSTGVYTPPTGATNATPGQLITSASWNNIHADIAGALTALGQGTQKLITNSGTIAIGNSSIVLTVTGAPSLVSGIDLDSLTFGSVAFRSTGFRVDGSGNIDTSGHLALNQPASVAASYTILAVDAGVICGAAVTLTLPAATIYPGRSLMIKNTANASVVSASANVVPLAGGSAAANILTATAGKWVTIVARGSNWEIMQGN